MPSSVRIPVEADIDVITARLRGSEFALALGFAADEVHSVAIAVSEVARNIVRYARRGQITFSAVDNGSRRGLLIVARDQGPGIVDLQRAMTPGFSTGNSLGLGLSSAESQMDEFDIASRPGDGTIVTMTKWRHKKRGAGEDLLPVRS